MSFCTRLTRTHAGRASKVIDHQPASDVSSDARIQELRLSKRVRSANLPTGNVRVTAAEATPPWATPS